MKIFGVARWILDADERKLVRAARKAKKEIKSVGEEADKTGKKVKKALNTKAKGAANSVEKLSGSLGKTIGIIGAVTASIGAVVKAVIAIKTYMESGEKVAARFLATLNTVTDTESSYKSLQERLRNVSVELEAKDAGGILAFAGRRRKQIEEEADALRKKLQSVNAQMRAARAADAREARAEADREAKSIADSFIKSLGEQNERYQISLLPEDDQIKANAELQKKALIEAGKKANIAESNDALKLALKNITDAANKKIEENKRVAEEEKKDKEAKAKELAEKQAAAFAAAMKSALDPMFESLTASFGTGFTTQLNGITREIQDVTREIRKVK